MVFLVRYEFIELYWREVDFCCRLGGGMENFSLSTSANPENVIQTKCVNLKHSSNTIQTNVYL